MWSSPASRRLGAGAGIAAVAVMLSACIGPGLPARHALQDWLVDLKAHSVAYAYTLLSTKAEQRTDYDQFFNGVNQSQASYRIVSTKTVSASEVLAVVAVTRPGASPARVTVQMVEEGNAGDWLVGEPFTSEGARAIRHFR